MIDELTALARLDLNSAETPDDVWRDSPYHIEGLHPEIAATVEARLEQAERSDGPSPIGLVLQGQKGVGKTHLLGMVRRRTHAAGGYFFLADLTAGDAFWENIAESLRLGLTRIDASGEAQLRRFLRRACASARLGRADTRRVLDQDELSRDTVDTFVGALRTLDPQIAAECGDTARALLLAGSHDDNLRTVGEDYLDSREEAEPGDRRRWGMRPRARAPLTIARETTRLLALTGPLAIGVDQLDTLIAVSQERFQDRSAPNAQSRLVAQIADGLMRLREVTRRTVTVLTCLPNTWNQIRKSATDTVADRFTAAGTLGRLPNAELGEALVAQRFRQLYQDIGFVPPYATWPVAPEAFAESWEYTPRELLRRIAAHVEQCTRTATLRELIDLRGGTRAPTPTDRPAPTSPGSTGVDLDETFDRIRREADPTVLFDPDNEDEVMPKLLEAALRAWIIEVGDDDMAWEATVHNGQDGLHAWLAHTRDESSDLVEYWGFRAIAAEHPNAALSRLRRATAAAKLRRGADNRHLVVLRTPDWSGGKVTQTELRTFESAGGRRIELDHEDARTFWALHEMFAHGGAELHRWLADRRPALHSRLLPAILPGDPGSEPVAQPPPELDTRITLGTTVDGAEPVRIELAELRRHAAVFAGSGSGKTVLLRRIVEECALRGVSAIVLDPNNDLARLGDAWPQPPEAWGAEDADLARRYLDGTDVVVWTPGRATARPLTFRPLPDFAGVRDDADEFAAAVEVAVAALAPQLRLVGGTTKVNIGLAVLRQAVTHVARTGGRSLGGLVDVLGDLPDGVSDLGDARRTAAGLAEALKAAMVNDSLFADEGAGVDPAELLTPAPGKKARVSVISFVGLPGEEQRRSFVNQLQMELFAWIKRNPAGEKPLGALFVMDEAQTLAASGSLTASTRSTIALASQARKYGLGLLFATQAPKGLHNQVTGNAMTQFFGRLNHPTQIAAANELARAKGSPVADISNLERAQFYVAGEAFGFRRISTPLCLSHHPASPLTQEEVLHRARGERPQ